MSQKNTVVMFITVMILSFAAAQAIAGMPVAAFSCWPDTGQVLCYTGGNIPYGETGVISCPGEGEDYYGQDSQYSINPPSYTKLDAAGNDLPDTAVVWSMVRDNVTGLVWEVKTDDDSIHDKDNTYTWYDSNPETNGGHAGTPGDGTDTEDFIQSLNDAQFGGHEDWRMPTVEELSTLLNANRSEPSINTAYFPRTLSQSYWTATSAFYYSPDYIYPGTGAQAWVVGFTSGYVSSDFDIVKSTSRSVRAVRGGTPRTADHLVDNGDTVSDSNSCLTWQRASADINNDDVPDKMTWTEALAYAENLVLDGHDGWRLPSSAELQSLVDYSQAEPAVDKTYFPDTASSADDSSYWTSTTCPNPNSITIAAINAQTVSFCYGRVELAMKSGTHYVRVVRDGQCGEPNHLAISSFSPVSGYASATSVTIAGTDFGAVQDSGSVTFGGAAAAIVSWSDTEIVCVAPEHDFGKALVVVTNDAGDSATVNFTYYDEHAVMYDAGALPDTGQDTCYDDGGVIPCPVLGDPFYGQDAQYTINSPSFTKLDANGSDLPDSATDWVMVRDNVTGLVWEVKSNDSESLHANMALPWCNTNPATNGGDAGCCDGYGYNTEDFIQSLNDAVFGGHTDWRMPSMADLATLMNHRQYLAFAPEYFPNMHNYYWSATTYSDYPSDAWHIGEDGRAGQAAKTNNGLTNVIAVRGGTPRTLNHFIDNGNGTVTDTRTCLTWQQTGMDIDNDGTPDKMTWEQALAYAESLEFGGHDDWRLPNRKELQAIMDYSHAGFFMDTNFFPEFQEPYYWSSTTAGFPTDAWIVSFNQYYGVTAAAKSYASFYVRAVRTAQWPVCVNLAAFAASFGSLAGDGNYSLSCDFELDGDVDGSDLQGFINGL